KSKKQNMIALLGDDLLSCCDFTHSKKTDIKVTDFDEQLYQATYSGAIKNDDLKTLIAEVTIPEV
ncbi:MAG: hypothetical protein IJ073_08115, partial [Lachnospiraceae bacterium]|nr:hypothetical protein [Lachnospiraceae bacterium]